MNPYRAMPLPNYPNPLPAWLKGGLLFCSLVLGMCLSEMACSPAQVAKIETGIPSDAALIGCVLQTALSTGGNVAAVGENCGVDALEVAKILFQAATLPPGARSAVVSSATALRSTPAFADAYHNYPRAAAQ